MDYRRGVNVEIEHIFGLWIFGLVTSGGKRVGMRGNDGPVER